MEYPPGAQEDLWNIYWIKGFWGKIFGIICLQSSFLGPRMAPGRPQEGLITLPPNLAPPFPNTKNEHPQTFRTRAFFENKGPRFRGNFFFCENKGPF